MPHNQARYGSMAKKTANQVTRDKSMKKTSKATSPATTKSTPGSAKRRKLKPKKSAGK